MGADDVLFYSDATRYFTGPGAPLVDLIRRTRQDVIAFRGCGMERAWKKRDTFVLMDCDTPEYADTFQVQAAFSLWRRTPFSMMIAGGWLRYAKDERLLTDIPNGCGKDNFPEFQAHRWDQSIWMPAVQEVLRRICTGGPSVPRTASFRTPRIRRSWAEEKRRNGPWPSWTSG